MIKPVHLLALAAIAIACSGCAGRPSQGVLTPITSSAEGTSRVAMLAATTRQRSTTDPGEMFNGERGDGVSYASIAVSIPPDGARKIGAVQWPASLPGDPRRDFVTVSANYLDKPAFTAALATLIKQSGKTKVLVFVHGFNTRFDDAVYRFAQIVHDSKVAAIPVLFTWPSRGETRLRAYTYDRESANYSRDALENLLDLLASQTKVTEISLLAHSMGNWVTLEALRGRSIRAGRVAGNANASKLKNVMLVAPDVDVDVFRTQLDRMGSARPRLALFVSQDDRALSISKVIWGDVPRLGDVDPSQEPYRSEFERAHIEVFDLTHLKSSDLTNHDKAFDDVTSVVAMIKGRLQEGQSLEERDVDAGGQIEQITGAVTGRP
jgi:esterase/lipase superfamily enzyme